MGEWAFPILFTVLFLQDCPQKPIVGLKSFTFGVIIIVLLHLSRDIGNWAILPSILHLNVWVLLGQHHIDDLIRDSRLMDFASHNLWLRIKMIPTRLIKSPEVQVPRTLYFLNSLLVGALSRGVNPIDLVIIRIIEFSNFFNLLDTGL